MNTTDKKQKFRQARRSQTGMTLMEVLVALAISGLTVGAVVTGYLFCVNSAEQSALTLAASGKAMERLEQTRCVTWDTASFPAVDQLVSSNFPLQTDITLDLSGSGSGVTMATNYVTITQISTNPPLRRIRVDCVWQFKNFRTMTSTVETCRAPDQ